VHPSTAESVLWYCGIWPDLVLCCFVAYRRVYRYLPMFAGYAVLLFGRAAFIYWVYAATGYRSNFSFYSFWTTEAALLVARGLAIGELAWSTSRLYPGFRAVLKVVVERLGNSLPLLDRYYRAHECA
jgi:hypothetical protein